MLAGCGLGVSGGTVPPDWLVLGFDLCFDLARAKKLSANSSRASSLMSSIEPAHVPSLRMAMNWSVDVGSRAMNARLLHRKPFSLFHSSTVSL